MLQALSSLQARFDKWDIEGVVKDAPLNSRAYEKEPTIEEYDQAVHQFRPNSARYKIVTYLLSATLKDCSLVIRISKDRYSLKLIDLDLKSISKMQHYYELDRKIATDFTSVLDKVRQTEQKAAAASRRARVAKSEESSPSEPDDDSAITKRRRLELPFPVKSCRSFALGS